MAHNRQRSSSVNQRAQLATAYQELGKELSSEKLRVVGNYTLGKVIGEGTYGKVRLGTHRITSTRVAIKQIPKAMSAQLTREIHHHRQLHHPHVTQLYEVIATESSIWLVTELCTGGELFDYLVEKGRLSEKETRIIFGQLCLAVAYIHGKGVVHRDLKLENVLLDEYCQVKLGDFGFTREFETGRLLDTFCGTTGYASPEMLLGQKYSGREVDIWSLGVIFYSLLCGGLPFDDDDEVIMRNKVIHGVYPEPEWLSEDARDLFRHILVKRPEDRYSVKQILAHPWFTKHMPDVDVGQRSADREHSEWLTSPDATVTTLAPLTADVLISPNFSSPSHKSDASVPSSLSDHSRHSTTSLESEPTTPDVTDHDDDHMPDTLTVEGPVRIGPLQRTGSQSTIKNPATLEQTPKASTTQTKRAGQENLSVLEEEPAAISPLLSSSSYPSRTPVRTKRRSVSSAFSAPPSPVVAPGSLDGPDYLSMLEYPHPVVFTSPLERTLLNTLSDLGIDTGQMVHSVLTNACDSSAAIWWMLKRKAERREETASVEEAAAKATDVPKVEAFSTRNAASSRNTANTASSRTVFVDRAEPSTELTSAY
ncbi:Pkinase-domain-containing protein [Calocera cornea HHB12733]|uniref:Pkinase-domain-containing protein n=1 Tax=Calocera cornea HHB12733 TaxID=1353952 RepID=A0A165HR47_9BASI|nr:Pkinase-domain-containing protein [Calocera cornea HHB12733]